MKKDHSAHWLSKCGPALALPLAVFSLDLLVYVSSTIFQSKSCSQGWLCGRPITISGGRGLNLYGLDGFEIVFVFEVDCLGLKV